jgi:prepilin-type N-terminal cleavage/methylation domain-containing protein
MKKVYSKGFTLIELLVVIAIIGILSGIVLTSLGSARNKAKQASATASMSSMRSQAELAATNGVYPSGLCTATGSAGLGDLKTASEAQSGGTAACAVKSDGTAWAAALDVDPSTAVSIFCVDSTGNATTTSAATAAGEVNTATEATPVCDGNAS